MLDADVNIMGSEKSTANEPHSFLEAERPPQSSPEDFLVRQVFLSNSGSSESVFQSALDFHNSIVEELVKDGDTVIVRMHDDIDTIIKIKRSTEQRIGKSRVNVSPIVGVPYGSIFEIRGRKLFRVNETCVLRKEDYVGQEMTATPGDNRSFTDTNTAQRLTCADIDSLREEGASANDIIASLIKNSDTWSNKTKFSQEKWIRRKEKKYTQVMRIIKCCPKTLCDVYFRKSAQKICNIRSDSLAQILSHGGIFAGVKALIFDSTIGLVVGAAAYRMRGHGKILGVYFGQQPHFDIVDRLNLSNEDTDIIQPIPSAEIVPAVNFVSESSGFLNNASAKSAFAEAEEQAIAASNCPSGKPAENSNPSESHGDSTVEVSKQRSYQSSGRQQADVIKVRQYLREGIQSLIIASKYHPLTILQNSIKLLVPSSPFVVYCEFLDPLVECYIYLQSNEIGIKLQIVDAWMRDYQTLPNRYHPDMNMSTSGGYLLFGVYVGSLADKCNCDYERKRPRIS